MTTPTPDFGEPWFRVVQGKQHMIADRRDHFIVANDVKTKQEVVSRIIACVNACQGIPTDRLAPGSVKALVEVSEETDSVLRYFDHRDKGQKVNRTPNLEQLRDKVRAALSPFQEPTP